MAFKSLILFKTLLHHFVSLLPYHSWEVTGKLYYFHFSKKTKACDLIHLLLIMIIWDIHHVRTATGATVLQS